MCAPGMSRRALRAVVVLLVLAGAVLLAPPATAVASRTHPVRVTVDALSPVLPGPDDTLTLTGRLSNDSDRRIIGTHLGLRVDGGAEIAASTQDVAPLPPGESLPFTLRVAVADLGLGDPGTYTLGVDLTDDDGTLTGHAGTRVPWSPPDADRPTDPPAGSDADPDPDADPARGAAPLKVAVVWPVTDVPHMEAVSLGTGAGARPVFRDDALAGEFGENGRLRQVVDAADGLPVTWTVDPGLLDEARGMAGGYRVAATPDAGDPQRSREGRAPAVAAGWLSALREAVGNGDVVALPYADPDLAAIAHGGTKDSFLGPVLRRSARWGGATAADVLRVPVRSDVAWPYGGALDAGITGLADAMGPTVLLASGQGLSTGTTRSRVSLGGGATALVGDPAAGAALAPDADEPDGAVAVRQGVLGALLDARLRGAGDTAPLLVVPPRQMAGSTARVLASALETALDAGWIQLVGLDEMTSDAADTPSAGVAAMTTRRAVGAGTRGGGRRGVMAGARGVHGAVGSGARGVHGAVGAGETGGRGAEAAVRGAAASRGNHVPVPVAVRGDHAPGSTAPRPAATRDRRIPTTPITNRDSGGTESYPQGLRAGEIPAEDLTAVAAIQPDLGTLSQVLSDPDRTSDAVHRAMLRAVSTGWRVEAVGGDADDRKSYTEGVRAYVDNSIASVHLLPKHGTVTMAGDSASIPVTVANGLQQGLGGMELRVVSSAPHRVTVRNPSTVVRAPAAANHTEQVRVGAHANGPVEITARLYTTATGRPWGDPVTFRVKVSRIPPLVVGVIAGGALLVLLAGVVKVRRVRLRDAGPAGGAGPAG